MVRDRRKHSNDHPSVGRSPRPFKCKHFFVFEEPDGPSVWGTCLKCGATQECVSFWEKPERSDLGELGSSTYDYGGMSP